MSSIDFDALKGASTRGVPEDGLHIARLERISFYEGDKGTQLITEWSNEANVTWTSWNRFDETGLSFTQELLDGLGVDRSKWNPDEFQDEVEKAVGGTYQVRTDSRRGRQGDKWFTNTYIEQAIAGRQERMATGSGAAPRQPEPDVPIDTQGLPERGNAPDADLFGDDDIPF
jgi:hypothetical protein